MILSLSILSLPYFLNIPDFGQHTLMKSLPVLKSTSNYFRWIGILPIPLILLTLLSLGFIEKKFRLEKYLIPACLILISVQILSKDLSFYEMQNYNPTRSEEAFRQLETGNWTPEVTNIGIIGADGKFQPGVNDAFTFGHSSALCYEPIFGYGLELLPIGNMVPGPVFEGDNINMKNPACYVFPEENGCRPGDHFRTDQIEEARKFVSYQEFEFAKPITLLILQILSGIMFAVCIVLLCMNSTSCCRKSRGRPEGN
jgi:hypothetical protein